MVQAAGAARIPAVADVADPLADIPIDGAVLAAQVDQGFVRRGDTVLTFEDFAQKMAAKAYFAELATARALGYVGTDVYYRAFRVMDETYSAVFKPEMPFVWQEPRTVTGTR